MSEPMTEAEARERLESTTTRQLRRHDPAIGNIEACAESCIVDAILNETDALAVLLDPETMLRAWEKAGRVEHVGWQWIDPIPGNVSGGLMEKREGYPHTSRMKPVWRIVPDEEEGT